MSSGADAAVVLAGGAGTRVGGRDKGLLEWRGSTLVTNALRRLAQAGFDEIIISANRHVEDYARLGQRVIADADPTAYLGPLAGIARALGAIRAPRLFTVPVDVPEWPLELPLQLAARLEASDCSCAVARVGERREPLFALYRVVVAGAARDAVATGLLSVREFQDRIGCIELDLPPMRAFANLNTHEAFAGARA